MPIARRASRAPAREKPPPPRQVRDMNSGELRRLAEGASAQAPLGLL